MIKWTPPLLTGPHTYVYVIAATGKAAASLQRADCRYAVSAWPAATGDEHWQRTHGGPVTAPRQLWILLICRLNLHQ